MEPTSANKDTKRTIEPIATDLEKTSVHTVKTNPNDTYPRAADDLSDLEENKKQPLQDDHYKELGRALLTRGGDTDKIKKTVKHVAIVFGVLAIIGLLATAIDLLTGGFQPFVIFDVALDVALLWSAYGLYRFHEFARMLCYAIAGVMFLTSVFAVIAGFFAPLSEMPTTERLLFLLYICIVPFSAWTFAYLGRRDVRRIFS